MQKAIKHIIFPVMVFLFCATPLSFIGKGVTEANAGSSVNHVLRKEIVTIVDSTTDLSVPLDSSMNKDTETAAAEYETYNPSDRRWCGVSSVIVAGNNIFAAWQTGGDKEPSDYNYITVAASTDGGNTWIDPFMIIDPPEKVMITVPMFYYNDQGQLFLLFFHRANGVYALPIYNADGDLSEITYDAPFSIGVKNSSFTKPTVLSDGTLGYVSGSGDPSTNDAAFYRSDDHGISYKKISTMTSDTDKNAKRYAESTLVELSDGRYWAIRRLENAVNGGMEQYFSSDKGLTWTAGESNLPKPFYSPGSRFDMKRLKSGALLLVTNAEGMGSTNRRKMTAYLSEDDGKTWNYSLLLDNYITSYPDIYQTDDGTIYILFDKNRYGEGGIRLCILTEEDIKAGEFISENSRQLIPITKIHEEYADIVSVNGAFEKELRVSKGTTFSELIKNMPSEITVTDEYGNNHVLSGTYFVSGYNGDVDGIYNGTFRTTLPSTETVKLQDSFNLLSFKVYVGNANDPNDGGNKSGCGAGIEANSLLLTVIAAGASFFVRKLKKLSPRRRG
ncbi:MAG: sialidase family protein [Candidatus Borkfalkiaceae bacterium]|nr:sialidase family protein [Christensenellaceae bacterium]